MLKILKASVRDTAIYSIGTFSSKLVGLVLVPLYTNQAYLSPKEYGTLSLIEANLLMFISVFGLGLCYALDRWYWDKKYIEKRKLVFSTVLLASFMIVVFLCLLLIPLSGTISQYIFENHGYEDVFILMVVNGGLEILAQSTNSLIRLKEKPLLYTTANLIKLGFSVAITAFFVTSHFGIAGIYYGQIIGCFVYFIVLFPTLQKEFQLSFNLELFYEMLRFRVPMLLPVVAMNIFSFNDRFVLEDTMGVEEAGIYSLGAKLANTIKVFLITAVWMAITPTIYRMMNEPNNKRFYSKIMTYLGLVVILSVLFFSLFSRELVMAFSSNREYFRAYEIIPIVALGILLAC